MHSNSNDSQVRLGRCQHGTYHLSIGAATVHLSVAELAAVHRAIELAACHSGTLRSYLSPTAQSSVDSNRHLDN